MFGKNTNIYKNIMQTATYFIDLPKNLEMINLGSTVSFNDFDYELLEKNGANLALSPQTLYYDYEILKKYIDHLSDNAIVCVGVCQFTFLVLEYKRISANLKYYKILDKNSILGYSPITNFLWNNAPCFVMPSIIKEFLNRKRGEEISTQLDTESKDALYASSWMEGWKEEFGWNKGFNLNEIQIKTAEIVYEILQEIFRYCKEKEKNPILIIPPVSENLVKLIPEELLNECFWKYIEQFENEGNRVINFWGDKELSDYRNFRDALNLNEKGKQMFSKHLNKAIFNIENNKYGE